MKNDECIKNMKGFGPSPIPEDGMWVSSKEIKDINGLSNGVGKCAPQQGACKLTLNVKNGVIKEALVECIGCSGMTHSAAMASEILCGKTLLEALNTDLVCDAINDAMKNIFLQFVYGRTQSAFSLGGLPIGTGLDDLGKDKQSKVATIYSNENEGTKYLQTAEGYISKLALDEKGEIIGYEYINTNKLVKLLNEKVSGPKALEMCTKTYGRFKEGKTFVDPRN